MCALVDPVRSAAGGGTAWQLTLPDQGVLHVINVHLKSKIPTDIPGQKIDGFTWRSADAWAEGSFISSMKRMSQALEVRRLVDQLLDADPDARIVVAGDFNAAPDEVPVLCIRGDVENTGTADLTGRVLVPIEHTIPGPARYTLHHQGHGEMLDHTVYGARGRKGPRYRNIAGTGTNDATRPVVSMRVPPESVSRHE